MAESIIRIGTRGSLLALKQSGDVRDALEKAWPGLIVELVIIKTTGDKILDVPLAKVGGKGLFVKEIEDALLAGSVDLAVHSMKDVPAVLPDGLEIGVVPSREDPRDVLVLHGGKALGDVPHGGRVGTSSLRRAAQVRKLRPDIRVETLRGNLETRLRKVREGMYEAIILAAAGLHRMGWQDRITAYLDPSEFLPAIGQGAIGIEIRSGDQKIQKILEPLHDPGTALAVEAERSLLRALEGGCQVPIGGFARVDGDRLELTGLVASIDGGELFRVSREGTSDDPGSLGLRVARDLLELGAKRILDEVYGS